MVTVVSVLKTPMTRLFIRVISVGNLVVTFSGSFVFVDGGRRNKLTKEEIQSQNKMAQNAAACTEARACEQKRSQNKSGPTN